MNRALYLLACVATLLYGSAALTQQSQMPSSNGPPPAPFSSQIPGEPDPNRSQFPDIGAAGGPPGPGACPGTLDLSTGCAQLVAFGGLF